MTQALQPQPKQPDAAAALNDWLGSKLPEIEKVLARSIPPDRFLRIVLNACTKTPALLQANRASLWLSIMQSAAVGLEPDGTHAALVPYKGQVQFQFMYRGLLRKAREAGAVADIAVQLVYEHDEFEWQGGTDPKVLHKPAPLGKRGACTGVYAVAFFKDPHRKPMVEVMDVEQVEHCRRSAQTDNVWKQHWGEQAKKTVAKRICKYLPLDAATQELLSKDDENEFGPAQAEVVDDGAQRPKTLDALKASLQAEASPVATDPAEDDPFADDQAQVGGAEGSDAETSPIPVSAEAISPLDPADPSTFQHRMRLGLMPSQGWEAWADEKVWRKGALSAYTPAQAAAGSSNGKRHALLKGSVQYVEQHYDLDKPETVPQGAVYADYVLAYLEERAQREAAAALVQELGQ